LFALSKAEPATFNGTISSQGASIKTFFKNIATKYDFRIKVCGMRNKKTACPTCCRYKKNN
jgi:hypothetical protein